MISSIYDFVLESVMGSSLSRFGGGSEAMAGIMPYFPGAMGLAVRLILGPFFVAMGLFILAGIIHLVLMRPGRRGARLRGDLPGRLLQRGGGAAERRSRVRGNHRAHRAWWC